MSRISRDRKTYTFTLRKDFRFSDGTPVRASAFARAIHRTLAPEINSPTLSSGAQHTRDILGAADGARRQDGQTPKASPPVGTSS